MSCVQAVKQDLLVVYPVIGIHAEMQGPRTLCTLFRETYLVSVCSARMINRNIVDLIIAQR